MSSCCAEVTLYFIKICLLFPNAKCDIIHINLLSLLSIAIQGHLCTLSLRMIICCALIPTACHSLTMKFSWLSKYDINGRFLVQFPPWSEFFSVATCAISTIRANTQGYMAIYYILCVDISVIRPWLKMIPVKWYDIISLQ